MKAMSWAARSWTALARAASAYCASAWHFLRTLATDDAYERYLAHHAAAHSGTQALDRKTFYMQEQQRKWTQTSRCC